MSPTEQASPARTVDLERFRAAMDATNDAIFLVDRGLMQFVECNTTACVLLGYTRDELMSLSPDQISTSPLKDIEKAYDEMIAHNATQEVFESHIKHKDGTLIPVEIHRHLHKFNGNWLMVGVVQDLRKKQEAAQHLKASEQRFLDLMQSVELASVMVDQDSNITFCNPHMLSLSGYRLDQVLGKNWFDVFPNQENSSFLTPPDQSPSWTQEDVLLTHSGEKLLIKWNSSLLHSPNGSCVGVASIGEDITEQRQAQMKIQRLNRVYSVLSQINALIVRVSTKEELYKEACRIAVEQGGFRMAFVGVLDETTGQITTVGSSGKNEKLLQAVHETLSCPVKSARTMIAQSMREQAPLVSNSIHSDSRLTLGALYVQEGVSSLAVLPLVVNKKSVGVLALYSTVPDFFHDEEMKLLTELTSDISFAIDHIEKAEQLTYLSYYDTLTGLANRTLFLDRLSQHMLSAAAGEHPMGMYLVDIERFKSINDSFGQSTGDELLRQMSAWLKDNGVDQNLLARVSADQFAVIIPEIKQVTDIARNLENILNLLHEHAFKIQHHALRINIKVGVAVFPDDGKTPEILFQHAEAALKKSKLSSDRYLFYTQEMTQAMARKLTLENQMRQALDQNEFVLFYQPKTNIKSGLVTSVEALIRWQSPNGLIPPIEFIPMLEETGLIHEVGRWVLRQAIADHKFWRTSGLNAPRIAVNVSPVQLRDRTFVDQIEQLLSSDPQAPAGLELELTEGMIMEDIKQSVISLLSIRALGVSVAIDDFGTGFSSLSYLAKLPVDTLKIDRSFITDMQSQEGLALVSTIVTLAHSLKLKVVAEGVETLDQLQLLKRMGCDEMQGYLFSKPVPKGVLEVNFLGGERTA